MSVLTTRLARIGMKPVNIVGDGNCFFRSVSHQLYRTENRHVQIRALAIQHLINCPEYFIESNTQQSWVQYLQNMSSLGTWADHIIIQAVANSNNLRIHITESRLNFSEATIVSSIYTTHGANLRDIYIGHLDEMHYVSTSPIAQPVSAQSGNEKTSEQQKSKTKSKNSAKTNETKSGKSVNLTRKDYMRQYMKEKRKSGFRNIENDRKKTYNKKYKMLNPEKVKESLKNATATYRQSNPEKVKKANRTYRELNPEKIKESFKKSSAKYQQSNPENSNRSTRIYCNNYPKKVKNIQKRQYVKRKRTHCSDETQTEPKILRKDYKENACDLRSPITIEKATELFHKNISVGPEYVCTCCDQLWYRSSVSECNATLYKSCSTEILNLCLTGLKSIDSLEWICSTCHSNLKGGKLPACAK